MKVKELANVAEKELKSEREEMVVSLLKESHKKVNACKKTLKALEKQHNELLESDVEDLELDGFEY